MSDTPRIALYCDSPVIGGAERALFTVAAAHHGEVELVVVSPSDVVVDAAADLVPEIERHRLVVRSGALRSIADHRREFRQLGVDLVQVTLPNPFTARSALLGAAAASIPTVAVEQLVLPPRRRRGAWLKRAVATTVSCTIAVGARTAADVHRLFGIPRKRITVVHNGIPAAVPEAHRFDSRPVIGCVARYEDQKALDRLVRAMVELPDARLVLCGDGSLRADLEDLAARLGIAERVEVGPWRADARAWIAGFDAFVLPSRDEAFPLTIVEAMLAGTPVIATDVGSVREAVIDDVTGILVPSGDHEALVGAIRRVLGDEELAARLSGAAEQLALERYTADQMARGYEAVWRRVLG